MKEPHSKPKFELPGYEVMEQIGHGAMATVWMARQTSLDRIVAIKFLSAHLLHDEEAVRNFQSESKAAAQLRHPGIVQVYDAGQHAGLIYYVMEYIAGCTIMDLLNQKGRLREKHALLIAEGVILALGYAWSQARLIHCDIKPENILVDKDGTIKVADLGLARIMGRYTCQEESETISGTPNYISPEQATGEPELDCRTDIYALGAMLYHMVTGQLPFVGFSERQALEMQCSNRLPDPVEVQPDISNACAWLIEKMMIKDRNLRTVSWSEMLEDVHDVMAGNTPAILPPSGRSTITRSAQRAAAPLQKRKASAQTAEKRKDGAEGGARQKIVLPKQDMQEFLSAAAQRNTPVELTGPLFTMVALLACVIAAFFGLKALLSPSDDAPAASNYGGESALPPRSIIASQTKKTETKLVFSRVEKAPSPLKEQPAAASSDNTASWKDPDFERAARDFNAALELYKRFQQDRQDPSALEQAEKLSRQAVNAFERIKDRAPASVHIEKLIQQCYQLIADCRHSTLLIPGAKGSRDSGASALAAPAEGSAPSNADSRQAQISLALNWNTPAQGQERAMKELQTLLNDWGSPRLDLAANPSLYLFGHIAFLMPAADAARMANLRLNPRRPVAGAGFPADSFFFYTLKGDFGEGFRELLLITDKADQVAGVQLVNNKPGDALWLDAQFFSSDAQTYNIIEGKVKPNAQWRIGRRVTPINNALRIDIELAQDNPGGPLGVGDSKARSSLILPEPMVNLILYYIEQSGGKPVATDQSP